MNSIYREQYLHRAPYVMYFKSEGKELQLSKWELEVKEYTMLNLHSIYLLQ